MAQGESAWQNILIAVEPLKERASIFLLRFWATAGVGLVALEVVSSSLREEPTLSQHRMGHLVVFLFACGVAALSTRRRLSLSERLQAARREYGIACRAFERREYERARDYGRRATELDPNWYQYANRYARALLRLGKYAEAANGFTLALESTTCDEVHRVILKNRALAWYLAGRPGESVNDYEAFLGDKPNHAVARRLLALSWTCVPGADSTVAVREAEEAVARRPKESTMHSTLAVVQARAGNLEAALAALAVAEDLDHTSPDGWYALAQARAAVGSVLEAGDALLTAVNRDSKFHPRSLADPLLCDVVSQGEVFLAELEAAAASESSATDSDSEEV